MKRRIILYRLFGYTPWRNASDTGPLPLRADGEMLDAYGGNLTNLARLFTYWHC